MKKPNEIKIAESIENNRKLTFYAMRRIFLSDRYDVNVDSPELVEVECEDWANVVGDIIRVLEPISPLMAPVEHGEDDPVAVFLPEDEIEERAFGHEVAEGLYYVDEDAWGTIEKVFMETIARPDHPLSGFADRDVAGKDDWIAGHEAALKRLHRLYQDCELFVVIDDGWRPSR